MTFLGRLTRGVGKAAGQAKFEADKLLRVNRLSSEVSQLTTEIDKATADIGRKVMELHQAGAIQVPGLDELIGRVETLQARREVKSAELEAVKAERFQEAATVAQATELAAEGGTVAPATEPALEADQAKFCPNCGEALRPGAKFCPSCGQSLA